MPSLLLFLWFAFCTVFRDAMEPKYVLVAIMSYISVCGCSIVLPNNCSETNVSLVSCGPRNSTRDQCLAKGCCWNSSSVANTTQCYGVANNQSISNSTNTTTVPTATTKGTSMKTTTSSIAARTPQFQATCQVYNGQVCDQWLNVTMLEYRGTPRFVDDRFGLNGTEKVIIEFMKAIDRIDEDQSNCKRLLKVLLCEYVLPPCNDKNERYFYCREDCEAIFSECNYAMREMLGAAKYILKELGLEFAHVGVPDCTKLYFSEEYKARNMTCIHWGLFEFTPSPTPTPTLKSSKAALTAGAAAGVSLFLLFIFIICCVYRKRKLQKARELDKGFAGVTFTALSMRDRIRAESIRALDESKVLSLFNPEDIIQLPLSSIEYIRDLGSGNFGLVFLGKTYGLLPGKEDAELLVAVKTLKEGSSTETKEDFFKEVALMSLLHHENIVELLAVSTEEEPYGMIFEFMELGDLNQYLRKAGPFFEGDEKERVTLTQDDLLSIALQCASGMEHLQILRFVHRDVATRNCLVGTGMIVKISDFGMSRDIYASDYYKVEGQAVLPIRWMPPEALLLGKFTVESDIYSFGVLLWEIYTLALQPYYGYTNEEVVEFIKKGVHLGQPDDCPDHVYQLMKTCWHKDASQRPNFTLMIAQLKQEVTSHYDSVNNSPESPVDDKQPLYQNINITPEVAKKEIPAGIQPCRKISQQALSTPKDDMNVKPSFINVSYNAGYLGDDEEVPVEEEVV